MTFKKGMTPWNKGKKLHYKVWNKELKGIHLSVETEFKKGNKPPKTAFKNGHIPWHKGKKFYEITGANNCNWKGDDVGYLALHAWISRKRGKPTKCEHCNKDGLTGHQIHWANISGEYKRELSDWIRLCVKCHRKFDCKSNFKKLETSNSPDSDQSALLL